MKLVTKTRSDLVKDKKKERDNFTVKKKIFKKLKKNVQKKLKLLCF